MIHLQMKKHRKIQLSLLQLLFASGVTCASSFLLCKASLGLILPGRTPWSPPAVTYYFSSSLSLPDNNFKNRVREGAQTWNNAPNSNFSFSEVASPSYTAVNQGVVTYEFLQDGVIFPLGKTTYIVFATPPNPNPSRFKVAFSTVYGPDWYSLTGQPSSNQYDFKSNSTHEFGHALLLAHPAEVSTPNCPNTVLTQDLLNYPTMCRRLLKGETFQRTLGTYDKSSIASTY